MEEKKRYFSKLNGNYADKIIQKDYLRNYQPLFIILQSPDINQILKLCEQSKILPELTLWSYLKEQGQILLKDETIQGRLANAIMFKIYNRELEKYFLKTISEKDLKQLLSHVYINEELIQLIAKYIKTNCPLNENENQIVSLKGEQKLKSLIQKLQEIIITDFRNINQQQLQGYIQMILELMDRFPIKEKAQQLIQEIYQQLSFQDQINFKTFLKENAFKIQTDFILNTLYNLEPNTKDKFILQYNFLNNGSIKDTENLWLLQEIKEDYIGNRNKNFFQIREQYLRLNFVYLKKQSNEFDLDFSKIQRIMQQYPKEHSKIMRHFFLIDKMKTSKYLIQSVIDNNVKQQITVHNEDFMIFLINKNLIQQSPLSKYLLQAVYIILLEKNNHLLKLGFCKHLIYCISPDEQPTPGDLLIFSFLHKLFIQNKDIMLDLVFEGFPKETIHKLVNNVESFHISMQHAEQLLNQHRDKQFIVNFFNEITNKYKNQRSQIIQISIDEIIKKHPYIGYKPLPQIEEQETLQQQIQVF